MCCISVLLVAACCTARGCLLYCSVPHAVCTTAGPGSDEVHRAKAGARNQQRAERVQPVSHDESRQLQQQLGTVVAVWGPLECHAPKQACTISSRQSGYNH
jgi:hypothetical protein